MKILITGVSGMLGYDLWRNLESKNELFGVGHKDKPEYVALSSWIKLDLSDGKSTYETITRINPDIVIHCAAISNVDYCQQFPDEAYRNNALATNNVVLACQRFDTSLVYISTDYVFDGENVPDKKEGYNEFCETNPLSIYAKSKLAGEYYVSHLLNKFYIVRTALLFGVRRNNLPAYVIDLTQRNQNIKIVTNQIGSPTYTKDLSQAIAQLIETDFYGIYHLTNDGNCTREEFIGETLAIAGLQDKAKKTLLTVDQFHSIAPRPKYSALNNYIWKLRGFAPLRNWKESLRDYLKEIGRTV